MPKDLKALLAAARSSNAFDVLQPVNALVVDTYPCRNHSMLVGAEDKVTTGLSLLIQFLNTNQKSVGKQLDEKSSEEFRTYKAKSAGYRLHHRVSQKAPVETVNRWWKAILALATEHVVLSMNALSLFSKQEKALFQASGQHVGQLSMSMHDAAKYRLHSIVNRLVADNPLSPGEDEAEDVTNYCLAQLGLSPNPTGSEASKLHKLVGEISKSLIRFREYLNHTVLWATTVFCHKETVQHFKNLHAQHARANSTRTEGELQPFTAWPIYEYLVQECSVDNDELVEQYKIRLDKMVRKNNVTLLQWLQEFENLVHQVTELTEESIDPKLETKLWKLTFAENINFDELTDIATAKRAIGYSASQWKKVAKFKNGVFDQAVLRDFLTVTQTYLTRPFVPDRLVKQNNIARFRRKGHNPSEICYGVEPPKKPAKGSKEVPKTVKGSKPQKAKAARGKKPTTAASRKPPAAIRSTAPKHLWCTNPACVLRKIQHTHTTANCLRRSAPRPQSSWSRSTAPSAKSNPSYDPSSKALPRACKICGNTHPYGQCPVLLQRRNEVTARLNKSAPVKSKLSKSFYNDELMAIATNVATAYDLPDICHTCLDPHCEGTCVPSQQQVDNVRHVKQVLATDHQLATAFREASYDQGPEPPNLAPLNVETFLALDQGLNTDTVHSPTPSDSVVASSSAGAAEDDDSEEENTNLETSQEATNTGAGTSDDSGFSDSDDDEPLEDGTDNEGGLPSYFTVGPPSPVNRHTLELDARVGIEAHSPVYSTLTAGDISPEVRRSLITECTADVLLPGGGLANIAIKVDNCNSRMLAGDRFVHDIKSCYEYGLPPVRMKTASKDPTSWKRNAGLLKYKDGQGVDLTSLVYVDYDNPELILMDRNTRLDAQIDEHFHAVTSGTEGVQPLKRFTKKPYHYLDFTEKGKDPWSLEDGAREIRSGVSRTGKQAPAVKTLPALRRSTRRQGSGSTKTKNRKRKAPSDNYYSDDCTCALRVVDSLSAEDYQRMKDGVSELSLRQSPMGILVNPDIL